VVLRSLLGGQDEGLQMTKEQALRIALDALGPNPPDCCGCQADWQIAIDAIKAGLKAQDEFDLTAQAHLLHSTIKSAINTERENCARLCDAYELPDVAQAIRTRSHQ
jgi:hypothetical protein